MKEKSIKYYFPYAKLYSDDLLGYQTRYYIILRDSKERIISCRSGNNPRQAVLNAREFIKALLKNLNL